MNFKHLLYTSTLAVILSSCASYNAIPLNNLVIDLIETTPQDRDISIAARAFSRWDCDRFLDRNVLAEGYQPLQLFIQNNSEHSYVFSLSRISLPTARAQEVAQKVHTSTVGRAIGYSIGALFIWPLAIPAIVDGIGSAKANDALDNDFLAKTATDRVIFPHSHLNAIVFIPQSAYQNAFTLTLIDYESHQPKTFNIAARS